MCVGAFDKKCFNTFFYPNGNNAQTLCRNDGRNGSLGNNFEGTIFSKIDSIMGQIDWCKCDGRDVAKSKSIIYG